MNKFNKLEKNAINCHSYSNDNKEFKYCKLLLDNCLKFIYSNNLTKVEYDACGHYALAYLYLFERTDDKKYLDAAENILNNLIKTKDLDNDGYTGWGLTFKFDAFNDKTFNDINTVYTYTTTTIGNAFLKAYNITKKDIYKTIVNEIRDTLINDIGYWEGNSHICFWYSNSKYDKKYKVHNVNAYTIQFLSELDNINKKDQNYNIIKKAFEYEKHTQLNNGNWIYCENAKKTRETDILHWAMSGTAYYRMFEIMKEEKYHIIARNIKDSIIKKHINNQYEIKDNSSKKWGAAEFIILLKQAFKHDNDKTFIYVMDKIQKKIDDEDKYLPFGINHSNYNHRVNSWYAYAFAFFMR